MSWPLYMYLIIKLSTLTMTAFSDIWDGYPVAACYNGSVQLRKPDFELWNWASSNLLLSPYVQLVYTQQSDKISFIFCGCSLLSYCSFGVLDAFKQKTVWPNASPEVTIQGMFHFLEVWTLKWYIYALQYGQNILYKFKIQDWLIIPEVYKLRKVYTLQFVYKGALSLNGCSGLLITTLLIWCLFLIDHQGTDEKICFLHLLSNQDAILLWLISRERDQPLSECRYWVNITRSNLHCMLPHALHNKWHSTTTLVWRGGNFTITLVWRGGNFTTTLVWRGGNFTTTRL